MDIAFFSRNGELLPVEKATIPLENISYQYGFGVYENLKLRKRILYFVKQHIERLFHSASLLELKHPFTYDLVEEWIAEIIAKNNAESCNIKILLVGAKTQEEAELFILLLNPLYPDRTLYSQGAKAQTTHYERFLPQAKTLNMLQSYLAFTKAQRNGCYDALLLDRQSNMLEGTRTNFFLLKDKTLFTAPRKYVLNGVTRQVVLAIAEKYTYQIEETLVTIDKISQYEGAFFTSTGANIIPIKQIDSFIFSEISSSLQQLMEEYDTFLFETKGVLD